MLPPGGAVGSVGPGADRRRDVRDMAREIPRDVRFPPAPHLLSPGESIQSPPARHRHARCHFDVHVKVTFQSETTCTAFVNNYHPSPVLFQVGNRRGYRFISDLV